MKYLLLCISSLIVISTEAMDISIIIQNESGKVGKVFDFHLQHSSVDLCPLQAEISNGSKLEFSIVPTAGNENDCFSLEIGRTKVEIWWNYTDKGYGPFIKQTDGDYRVIKSKGIGRTVLFQILKKSKLQKEKAMLLSQQDGVTAKDISEQTGFTETELKKMQIIQ